MVFCTRRRVLRPLSATMQSMNEAKTGRSWLTEAKQDISQWSASMPKNADNERIDWHWVMSLDLEHGIGAAKSQGIDLIAVLNAADTTFSSTSEKTDPMQDSVLSVQQLHNLLKKDLAVRDRLESIIAQCNTTFMTDFDRLIASYVCLARSPMRTVGCATKLPCCGALVLRWDCGRLPKSGGSG